MLVGLIYWRIWERRERTILYCETAIGAFLKRHIWTANYHWCGHRVRSKHIDVLRDFIIESNTILLLKTLLIWKVNSLLDF